MTLRKNRRAVMAELLLLATPTVIRLRGDGVSMAFEFDSIIELRSWLHLAGLDFPDLLTSEYRGVDGQDRPYRRLRAFLRWHGWDIYATGTEYANAGQHLDPQTTEQLTALAAS